MAEGPQIATRMSSRERIVVLLLVISVVINYVDRSNLSLAVPLIQRQFALLHGAAEGQGPAADRGRLAQLIASPRRPPKP